MSLWIKPGQDQPRPLPFKDMAGSDVYTDLANNPDGREACGYVEAPAKPPFNPSNERVEWAGGFEGGWQVVPTTPRVVSRLQLRLELLSRDLLDDVEALVAAGGKQLEIYWADTSEFHIDHPALLALVAQGGWSQQLLDEVFTAAKFRV